MDIDLKQGLAGIADDAPTAHLSAETLWRQGVRRRNRRRVAAAGVVVAVTALVAGAVGTLAATGGANNTAPPVAGSRVDEAAARLPDTLWGASPWTAGTERAGDPGRIAVLYWDNWQRQDFWGSSGGYVAVSALDGEYRYLDAPGLASDGDGNVSLSPDGRFLAYPVHDGPGADGADGLEVATEWRVYDAETGEVRTHLFPDLPKGLTAGTDVAWSPDSRTVLVDVCRVTRATDDGLACRGVRTDAWDVVSGDTRRLPWGTAGEVVGHHRDRLVVSSGGHLREVDLETGRTTDLGRLSLPGRSVLAVDVARDVRVVSGPGETNEGELRVSAAPLGTDGISARAFTVDSFDGDTEQVAGLTPRADVLLVGSSPGIVRLRGLAGERTVVRASEDFGGASVQVATDLVGEPTVHAARPDAPTSPQVLAAGAAGAVLLLAGLAWALRRRRLRSVTP